MTGEDLLPGIVNYLLGNNPAMWHTNIRTFAQVRYHAIYPGVDLLYDGAQGHLEYDSYSLFKEYLRDIARYLSGERETYPELPHGYFEQDTAAAFAQFRERALANRSPDLMSSLPLREAGDKLVNTWHSTATSIYRGWLRWIVERRAGRVAGTDCLASAPPSLGSQRL